MLAPAGPGHILRAGWFPPTPAQPGNTLDMARRRRPSFQPGWTSRRVNRARPAQVSIAAVAIMMISGVHVICSAGRIGVAENGSTSSTQPGRWSVSPISHDDAEGRDDAPGHRDRHAWQIAEQQHGEPGEHHDGRPIDQSRPGDPQALRGVTDRGPVPDAEQPAAQSEQCRSADRRDQQAFEHPPGPRQRACQLRLEDPARLVRPQLRGGLDGATAP